MYNFPVSEICNHVSVLHLSDAHVPLDSTLISKAELYDNINYRAVSTCMNSQFFSVVIL